VKEITEEHSEYLMKAASLLASRYKDTQEYQDLYQEGFLAGWEALSEGADMPIAIGEMRSAMRDYMNISMSPVSVPKSGEVRAFLKRLKDADGSDPQGSTEMALWAALTGSTEGIQPNTLGTERGVEEELIEKDLYEHLLRMSWLYLNPEEAIVMYFIFVEDYNQEEVAEELELGQASVSRYLRKGLAKLKKALDESLEID